MVTDILKIPQAVHKIPIKIVLIFFQIKSVFDLETQPFDTDEVEVMDSSTQVDEEVDICTPVTPKKDDSLIAKQIDKGKLLFEKICTSASKLKGRLSRKRKAEDSCMDENVEKSGKKQHEMDREIEETSRVQKENKNIGTSKGVFQVIGINNNSISRIYYFQIHTIYTFKTSVWVLT